MLRHLPGYEPFLQNIAPSMAYHNVATFPTPIDGVTDTPSWGKHFPYTDLGTPLQPAGAVRAASFWRQNLLSADISCQSLIFTEFRHSFVSSNGF